MFGTAESSPRAVFYYMASVAFAVTLLGTFGLDGQNSIGLWLTGTLVYGGATIAALGYHLRVNGFSSQAWSIPVSRLLGVAVALATAAIFSGIFWYVALGVSIIVLNAALPLRVLLEQWAAPLFRRGCIEDGIPDRERVRFRARLPLDIALVGLVLGTALWAKGDISGVSWTDGLLLVGLVLSSALSELLIGRLQTKLKARPDERAVAPELHALLLGVASLLFFVVGGLVTQSFVAVDLHQSNMWIAFVALPLVGAFGAFAPTLVKMDLLRTAAQSSVAILALAFNGAGYVMMMLVQFALALVSVTSLMDGDTIQWIWDAGTARTVEMTVAILVAIFLVDRFLADRREDARERGDQDTEINVPDIPATLEVTEGTDQASKTQRAYDVALEKVLDLSRPLSADDLIASLNGLEEARRDVGLDGFRNLSTDVIRRVASAVRQDEDEWNRALRINLGRFVRAQRTMLSEMSATPEQVSRMSTRIYASYLALHKQLLPPLRYTVLATRTRLRLSFINGADRMIRAIGQVSPAISKRLSAVSGQTGLERWAHRTGWVFENFLGYDALRNTGLETSWGFRFVIPGTGGLVANGGGWAMFYTGSLHNYQSMAVPMRINPGFTVATPFWVFTLNRPGIGMGPSLPWASAYVDSQRYKLLLGIDGVGYARVGEWEGRGPYGTVSGSLPFIPGIRITWNASIFSPGMNPIVKKATPLARNIRMQTMAMVVYFQVVKVLFIEKLTRRWGKKWSGRVARLLD